MSMSKLKGKRAAQCSSSSSEGEGDGSQPQVKRRRQALVSYVLTAIREDIKQEIRSVLADTVREVFKEELQHINSNVPRPWKGNVVESGLEASIKLDVVVLEGDFNKDNSNDWTIEEFESYQMREREGKAPLLVGNLQVTLKGGVGELGKLKFTDNSSWNRSKMYRIGLKVASGFCEGVRIREAITEALRVKDHRGELNKKHYPAKPDDAVWRLKKIAKDGPFHTRLIEKGVLGVGMTDTKWADLIDHAKSCVQGGKLYLYSYDEGTSHAVVFNIIGQLKGYTADGSFFPVNSLPHELMEHLKEMVGKAYDDWDRVKEFNSSIYSMQNPLSGYNETKVDGSNVAIQNPPTESINLPEVPLHQNLAPTEPYSTPPTFDGHSTSSFHLHEDQGSMENLCSTSPQVDHGNEAQTLDSDTESWMMSLIQSPSPNLPQMCRSRTAVQSWLIIKVVFKWGFFGRRKVTSKVRPIIEQLN